MRMSICADGMGAVNFRTFLVVVVLSNYAVGQYENEYSEYTTHVDFFPKIFLSNYEKGYPAPNISPFELDFALQEAQTTMALQQEYENRLIADEQYLPMDVYSPYIRQQTHYIAKPKYLFELENHEDFMEKISQRLQSRKNFHGEDVYYGLPNVLLDHMKDSNTYQFCQQLNNIECEVSPFRSIDGTCNNPNKPHWGRSFSCFQRLLPPDYADGISEPRSAKDGFLLPNPRLISTELHTDESRPAATYTHILMQWGQFMDHDFTFTKSYLAGGRYVLNCCPDGSNNHTSFKYGFKTPPPGSPTPALHPNCFPINIPPDDDFYSRLGQSCIPFVRSASCSSCTLGPRQQTNQVTSFADASTIYGNTPEELNSIRDPTDPALIAVSASGNGFLLPKSNHPNIDQCSNQVDGEVCFTAGDVRVNQNPGLTVLHTLFARQHNDLANKLRVINPHWDAERLFQETRRIVIAQIQYISYREYLHLVIGPTMMTYFDLWPLDNGRSSYSPILNPTLFNEFAGAAYRYGHSLINNGYMQLTTSGQQNFFRLQDNFFNPLLLRNGSLDAIIKGLCYQPAQSFDRHVTSDMKNHLYQVSGHSYGLDIASLNIQRGRDHGIRGYTAYIKYCFDKEIHNFEELSPFIPPTGIQRLRTIYRNPEDIDLWTGGLFEYRSKDAVVGPTFGCIIGQQYYYSKFGDRYFFEHGAQPGAFTDDQLAQIRLTWLSKIICTQSDFITHSKLDVFQPESEGNPTIPCSSMADVDLNFWREIPTMK